MCASATLPISLCEEFKLFSFHLSLVAHYAGISKCLVSTFSANDKLKEFLICLTISIDKQQTQGAKKSAISDGTMYFYASVCELPQRLQN